MNRLLPGNEAAFRERFTFYDGLIRSVAIREGSAEIVLSVRDRETSVDEGWVNLRLAFTGLVEHAYDEDGIKNRYGPVMSDDLQLHFHGDVLYFDVLPWSDVPNGLADIRRSNCMVAARECRWTVEPWEPQTPRQD